MDRKSLRTTLFILFFILILLLALYFYMNMRREKIESKNDAVTVQSPFGRPVGPAAEELPPPEEEREETMTAMEPQPEETEVPERTPEPPASRPAAVMQEEPALPERYITGHHTVQEGESFSLITGYYWKDIFLWPDLYVRNDMKTDDPDLIYPKEIVDIYNRLGNGDNYTEVERDELIKSYLKVYRIYKALGPEKNNSVWSLLWCAAKYDRQFLDKYAAFIDPEDLAMARKYLEEEGFLE